MCSGVYKGVGVVKAHVCVRIDRKSDLVFVSSSVPFASPTKARAFNPAVEVLVPPAIYAVFPP